MTAEQACTLLHLKAISKWLGSSYPTRTISTSTTKIDGATPRSMTASEASSPSLPGLCRKQVVFHPINCSPSISEDSFQNDKMVSGRETFIKFLRNDQSGSTTSFYS